MLFGCDVKFIRAVPYDVRADLVLHCQQLIISAGVVNTLKIIAYVKQHIFSPASIARSTILLVKITVLQQEFRLLCLVKLLGEDDGLPYKIGMNKSGLIGVSVESCW